MECHNSYTYTYDHASRVTQTDRNHLVVASFILESSCKLLSKLEPLQTHYDQHIKLCKNVRMSERVSLML